MAITFVNAGTAAGASSGNITPGAPATPVVGDIWVCVPFNATDPAATNIAMNGADWTEVFDASHEAQTRLAVFWHRYAGVDPDRLVTMTDGGSNGRMAQIAAFRGAKASGTPVQIVGAGNGADSASLIGLSITPPVANAAILWAGGIANDPSLSTPASYSIGCSFSGVFTGNDVAGRLFYRLNQPASATGNVTSTAGAADHWTAVLLALEEEPPATAAAVILMQED